MRHVPSVRQSGSGRHLTEGIRFSSETFCDGFILHGVLARSLQFNPQALDAYQPFAVFFDSGPVRQAGSMRQVVQKGSPPYSYTRPRRPSGIRLRQESPSKEVLRASVLSGIRLSYRVDYLNARDRCLIAPLSR
jgi:hypothetical protein